MVIHMTASGQSQAADVDEVYSSIMIQSTHQGMIFSIPHAQRTMTTPRMTMARIAYELGPLGSGSQYR